MDKITAETIKALIARRYDSFQNGGQFCTFFELRSETGGGAAGAIDAFVMNVWTSKNYERLAFEIKVSRNDLMHELNNPDKRQWAFDISNEFWFVCAPGICTVDEIPENCGLMMVSKNGKKLMTKKRAQYREASDLAPWEIASIIRAASRMQHKPDESLWKYQGQDLTEKELDEIIKDRWSYGDQSRIDNKAKEIAESKFRKQNEEMALFAEELSKAGIDPPGFMTGKFETWTMRAKEEALKWVDKHFVVGPDAIEIRAAIKAMKNADLAVKEARDRMINLVKKKEPNDGQASLAGAE